MGIIGSWLDTTSLQYFGEGGHGIAEKISPASRSDLAGRWYHSLAIPHGTASAVRVNPRGCRYGR
jgi:hypothetical protein